MALLQVFSVYIYLLLHFTIMLEGLASPGKLSLFFQRTKSDNGDKKKTYIDSRTMTRISAAKPFIALFFYFSKKSYLHLLNFFRKMYTSYIKNLLKLYAQLNIVLNTK